MAKSFRTKTNVTHAWNWVKSNPDRTLKDGYGMRDSYHNFTIVEESFLDEIVTDLRVGMYNPTPACKVYLPKPSGGLRPYTLLTIKDQVVYQALMNVIAEQLLPKVRSRYYDKVFGNLYAGEKSVWFYKKWKTGYKKFCDSARAAFSNGKIFMASFDLVACYDSIDHKVLSHYLREIRVPQDAIDQLLGCLSIWTSTDHDERIYQGHGIPQGPMSSGLLSEVVLSAFDAEKRTSGVVYLRYVDDIWFFAENERDLRAELVRMDRVCKKVGLFPQSSKINIRQVKNIESELKTVSGLFEESGDATNIDYFDVLVQITPSYKIKDISKFKYCALSAKPTARLIDRLWRIYANRPEIYPQVCSAILRAGKLSKSSRENFKIILGQKNPYLNIQASCIEVLCRLNLSHEDAKTFSKIVKEQFGTGTVFRNSDARLTALAFEFLYKNRRLTDRQLSYICRSPFWYTRREIARFLDSSDISLMRNYLSDGVQDVQLASAANIVVRNIQIPPRTLPMLPNSYFTNLGLITVGADEPCKINLALGLMLGTKSTVNWRRLLGTRYLQALKVLVGCNAAFSTNVGAWICELDVFNEIVVRAIFERDATIGTLTGNYGSVLNQPTSRFAVKYRDIYNRCKSIHDRRRTTPTTHAYDLKTQTPTRPFKHKEVPMYKKKQVEIVEALAGINV